MSQQWIAENIRLCYTINSRLALLNGSSSTSKSMPELICIPSPSPEVLCAVQLKEYFLSFFLSASSIELKAKNVILWDGWELHQRL